MLENNSSQTLMCQNSLCVFFWLIWLSAPSVKFEQAKDNKNDEVRSHHQDHHKKKGTPHRSLLGSAGPSECTLFWKIRILEITKD